jgi:hypothetical protein
MEGDCYSMTERQYDKTLKELWQDCQDAYDKSLMEKSMENISLSKKQFEHIADCICIWINKYLSSKPIDQKCFNYILERGNNTSFVKQEKPMENKVIFESEEDFYNLMFFLGYGDKNCPGLIRDCNKLKDHGYIRKSAVEEAENIYRSLRYDEKYTADYYNEVIDKLFKAIQELKAK